MSFILDALRKVEDEKRRGSGSQSTEPGMGGADGLGRRRQTLFMGRQTLFMGAIALASAAVTAVVLSLFLSGGQDANGLNEARTEAVPTSPLPEPVATLALGDGDDELEFLPPLSQPEPEPEPPPEPEPEAIVDANEASAFAPAALGETPAAEPPPPEPERAPPIRVVGRERSARVDSVPRVGTDVADEPPEPELEPEGEAVESGEAIPSLVLQGTSVIDGNPVAVISDQRVFEGDLIEGARVVRIGEREVELELEGKRFVLRL